MADVLKRCEALVDDKKINEAVDILNRLGRSSAASLFPCARLRNARKYSYFLFIARLMYNIFPRSGGGGGGGRERGGGESQGKSYSPSREGPI